MKKIIYWLAGIGTAVAGGAVLFCWWKKTHTIENIDLEEEFDDEEF